MLPPLPAIMGRVPIWQKPLAERLFFAGEAVAGPYKMLCSGAYMSGEVVANDVATVIG